MRQVHSYDIRPPDERHQTSGKCPVKPKKRNYFLLAEGQGLVGMAETMCSIWVGRDKGEGSMRKEQSERSPSQGRQTKYLGGNDQ